MLDERIESCQAAGLAETNERRGLKLGNYSRGPKGTPEPELAYANRLHAPLPMSRPVLGRAPLCSAGPPRCSVTCLSKAASLPFLNEDGKG